jgi:hypothetical protein
VIDGEDKRKKISYLNNLEAGSLCSLGCDFPLVGVEVQRNSQDRVVLVHIGGGVGQGDIFKKEIILKFV